MLLNEIVNNLSDLDSLLAERVVSERGVRGRGAEMHAMMLYRAKTQYLITLVKRFAEQLSREAEVHDRTVERGAQTSEQGGVRSKIRFCPRKDGANPGGIEREDQGDQRKDG